MWSNWNNLRFLYRTVSLCIIQVSICRSLRKRQRVERQARLANKVNTIKEHMKQQEQALESDWSVSWLLVGFVIMIGYCAYYILS